jgi:hypothetical protein
LHGGITFETNRLKAKRKNIDIELVTTKNNKNFLSLKPHLHKQWRFWFLSGSPTNFEIRIFLSLHLILRNVKSVSWMLKKLDRWPGKIGRTEKIGPILAVLCKQPFTDNF